MVGEENIPRLQGRKKWERREWMEEEKTRAERREILDGNNGRSLWRTGEAYLCSEREREGEERSWRRDGVTDIRRRWAG